MAQKFKIGDVVVLKSGGPKMTITKDKNGLDYSAGSFYNGKYDCTWFDGDSMQSNRFPQDSLKLSE